MKSDMPKVLHPICGQPMVARVIGLAEELGIAKRILVVGYGEDQIQAALGHRVQMVEQKEQLGSGHALMQAVPPLRDHKGQLLVLYGDTPLLPLEMLKQLISQHEKNRPGATILTTIIEGDSGYGRIVKDQRGRVLRIVEQKDCNPHEYAISEVNTGIYCFDWPLALEALPRIKNENAQHEYYLTDLIGLLNEAGHAVEAVLWESASDTMGVNNRKELAEAARLLRRRVMDKLMLSGVTITDPETTYIEESVTIARDTVIHPLTFLEGNTRIASHCVIGPGARLSNCVVEEGATIFHSVAVDSTLGPGVSVGPFSNLRKDTHLGEGVKIGDFVETKNSVFGKKSKAQHLSYVGDATIGEAVNVGAGVITCNYDGKRKHPTVIEDGAFIGSNTNLRAPVKIGAGAITGCGSVVTKDVPPNAVVAGVPAKFVRERGPDE